MTENRNQL